MSHILGKKCNLIKQVFQGNLFTVVSAPKLFCTKIFAESVITDESNPANHNDYDIGKFYKIDNKLSLDCLFKEPKILREDYLEECKTFQGTYIMIRKPALEIIHYMKHSNYDYPVNKYVLYGKYGIGVTMTMLHVIHYAHLSDWLIIHVPKLITWLTAHTERVESETRKGLLDLPTLGSAWLTQFKVQNLNVITKFDLRLQKDYRWNIQEENKKGDTLLSLIDHGISRGKYSCEVVMAVLDEVKEFSRSGKVKSLVAIDNYSVIFHPARKSSNSKFRNLAPSQLSFMESFKNMAKADWNNGAVLLSCHSEKNYPDSMDHYPLKKLSLKGFEFLNPFIPVEVYRLTEMEMNRFLEFYKSKNWLLSPEGDEQIKVLSAGNIATFQKLCGYFQNSI